MPTSRAQKSHRDATGTVPFECKNAVTKTGTHHSANKSAPIKNAVGAQPKDVGYSKVKNAST